MLKYAYIYIYLSIIHVIRGHFLYEMKCTAYKVSQAGHLPHWEYDPFH